MERENVVDVDATKRYEEEWAETYHITLGDGDVNSELMSEFEWAYRLNYARYSLTPDADGSYDDAQVMEARAMAILADVMVNADPAERRMLKGGTYVETKYILKYLTTH